MLIEDCTLGHRNPAYVEDDLTVNDSGEPIGREVVGALLWHNDEVRVSNPIAVNEIADTLTFKVILHPAAYPLCHEHDALSDIVRQVGEVIDVSPRDDEAFAGCGWLQRHECRYDVVVVHEARGSLVREDLAEDTVHDLEYEGVK